MRQALALCAVLALAGLHQDFWLWDDTRIVLGFLPSGLAYHVAYSVATAGLWGLIVHYAWPAGPDAGRQAPGESGERGQ